MPITVIRNPKESSERVIAKFHKVMQKSRVVLEVRKTRYRDKKPTRRIMRRRAMMRDFYRAKREKTKYY